MSKPRHDYKALFSITSASPYGRLDISPENLEQDPCDGDAWANQLWCRGSRQTSDFQSELSELNRWAGFDMMCDAERLSAVPDVYRTLFYRTRKFTTTVKDLVHATQVQASGRWAEAACLLISWSVDILRHEKIGFERFLLSQRESIYWTLDDALLRICLDQWENGTSSEPWNVATKPLILAISKAQEKLPEWGDRDCEEVRRWGAHWYFPPREVLEKHYFHRSRKFLHQSTRTFELWRTMRLWGNGLLPAELANAIVEDVSKFEELYFKGDLRSLFFTDGKANTIPVLNQAERACEFRAAEIFVPT